jgi:curli production assembly/transport component CsgF
MPEEDEAMIHIDAQLARGRSPSHVRRSSAVFAAVAAAILAIAPTSAFADDQTFQFVNPSFGGNPFNSSHLLAVASAQNENERRPSPKETQSELFVRLLQSRLLSALAGGVSDAILGENAQPTGRIVYGEQTVQWETQTDTIRLTITDTKLGSTTVVEIPKAPIG